MNTSQLLPDTDRPSGPRETAQTRTATPKREQPHPRFAWRGLRAVNAALQAAYERMRQELESLLSQPDKDMAEVDRLVNELDRLQLAIKAELGIRGNNPNE